MDRAQKWRLGSENGSGGVLRWCWALFIGGGRIDEEPGRRSMTGGGCNFNGFRYEVKMEGEGSRRGAD
jgi:hypothetical protein